MIRSVLHIAALVVLLAGCRQEMADQPRVEPYESGAMFEDSLAMRHPVRGTVSRSQPLLESYRPENLRGDFLLEGDADEPVSTDASFPFAVTREVIERGRGRFDIYCSPCHGRAGYGLGIVVQRGLRKPPSFHTERLRNAPPAHFYSVITNGYGAMYSYAARVSPADRWAVTAYIRALQLSQHAPSSAVPSDTLLTMDRTIE